MEFNELTMSVNYQRQFHLLKRVSEGCELFSPKTMKKLKKKEHQLFMLQVIVLDQENGCMTNYVLYRCPRMRSYQAIYVIYLISIKRCLQN